MEIVFIPVDPAVSPLANEVEVDAGQRPPRQTGEHAVELAVTDAGARLSVKKLLARRNAK